MTSQTLPPRTTAAVSLTPRRPGRTSSWALGLALLAAIGGIAAMGAVGATVVPMEAASGYYLTDTPGWYQAAVVAGFGSLVPWSLAGLAAIVLGVIGLRSGGGRTRAITALVLAASAPFLALAALLGGMGVGAALL